MQHLKVIRAEENSCSRPNFALSIPKALNQRYNAKEMFAVD